MQISLIIPIKNEGDSLKSLIASIKQQTFQPTEIILVDGGSNDNTVEVAEHLIAFDFRFKLIKTPKASPGKGRNIGAENASHEWLAFTDAGIKLDDKWLENLVKKSREKAGTEIVYGNFSPITDSLFEKSAMIAYVPPQNKVGIRSKFIASSLMKKSVWESVGGFPDLRAAEDLIFMEAVERENFETDFAPNAMVYWQLRPDIFSTFQKFVLYSKHNVWAGRQWDWHYGIAKYYLLLIPIIVLLLMYSWWWFIGVICWLFARTVRRVLMHRHELGLSSLFNPALLIGAAFLVLVIDTATFVGWAQAMFKENE